MVEEDQLAGGTALNTWGKEPCQRGVHGRRWNEPHFRGGGEEGRSTHGVVVVRLEWAELGRGRLTVVELVQGHDLSRRAQRTVVAQRGLLFSGCGRGRGWDRAATTHPANEQDDGAKGEGAVRGGRSGQRCGGTEAEHGGGRDVCGACVYVGRGTGS